MLSYIKIKNYILIKNFEGRFKDGFATIIGETGAGKSMILSAIDLACGKRINFDVEKNIKDKAEISIGFVIKNNESVKKILREKEIEFKDECIIKRIISKDGKNSAFVNNTLVSLKDLVLISSNLIEIFSQNTSNKIFSEQNQVNAFDYYSNTYDMQQEIQALSLSYRSIKSKIENEKKRRVEKKEKLSLLEYQIKEFSDLNLEEDEYKNLENEFDLINNAKDYKMCSEKAYSIIQDEQYGIRELLSELNKNILLLNQEKESVISIFKMSSDINSIISDLEKEISLESESYNFDEEKYFEIENRIKEIEKIAKKNNVLPENLFDYINEKENEYNSFVDKDINLEDLELELEKIKENWINISNIVSKKRKESKSGFIKELEGRLKELKMADSKIDLELKDRSYEINEYGNEFPEIKISTNLGQDFDKLESVMSGGEASRFTLALQTLLNKKNKTIMFDEIDTGIGGVTANNVGEYMRKISKKDQVIAITHLPQVVLYSDYQFVVKKNPRNSDNITDVFIEEIKENRLVYEVARMMGHEIINKNIKDQIIKMREEKIINV